MAVEISQRVLDMVRRELVQNPDVDNAVLYDKAHSLDPESMKDVDRRQFNARYPLRVKRFELKARTSGKPKPPKQARERKPRRPRTSAAEAAPAAVASKSPPAAAGRPVARDNVRDVLLRFAQDLANAESRGDIVGVVASVDRYVDQVMGLGSFGG